MLDVQITVLRKANFEDLSRLYEQPMREACTMKLNQVFVSKEAQMPKGFCESAWLSLYPYVLALACGGSSIHGEWMKNPYTALVSCNDGFRPVSFLLEALRESTMTKKG